MSEYKKLFNQRELLVILRLVHDGIIENDYGVKETNFDKEVLYSNLLTPVLHEYFKSRREIFEQMGLHFEKETRDHILFTFLMPNMVAKSVFDFDLESSELFIYDARRPGRNIREELLTRK